MRSAVRHIHTLFRIVLLVSVLSIAILLTCLWLFALPKPGHVSHFRCSSPSCLQLLLIQRFQRHTYINSAYRTLYIEQCYLTLKILYIKIFVRHFRTFQFASEDLICHRSSSFSSKL